MLNIYDLQQVLDAAPQDGIPLQLPAGRYHVDRLSPKGGQALNFPQGCEFVGLPGAIRLFQIEQPAVTIRAYKCVARPAPNSLASHTVIIRQGADFSRIEGLEAWGTMTTKDAFYVGGDPASNNVPKGVELVDCVADGRGLARNALSIVAGHGTIVRRGAYKRAGFAPGMGIDLEANMWMANGEPAVKDTRIVAAEVFDNPNNAGVGSTFATDMRVENCTIYGNRYGIFHSGGKLIKESERFQVESFDPDMGWIFLTEALPGDIVPGMLVNRSNGNWPQEYWGSATFDRGEPYRLGSIAEDRRALILANDAGQPIRPSTETADDLHLWVYGRPEATGKVQILNNHVSGNEFEALRLMTTAAHLVAGNEIITGRVGAMVPYCRGMNLIDNDFEYTGTATNIPGISAKRNTDLLSLGNTFSGFTGPDVNQ